ncbi:putative glycosyltransferase (plasmid) [Mycolicibacterium chubuense NBB4]|uniref:Mycofactocin system glycosyltransferase n=2 Tax=Mycolicibacterium TaxID=1866885 RepID=A0ABX2K2V9_9MYCO|nr:MULTISPECIES: mycofactocin biosynthesis glycosyltransferase MftF [Mycolicibacterium]AFM20502.1 putative glycosyltransferase [Mycolicibacterium chubuense NBB4]NTY63970.1 mycofactocin system glycosyltransferase [Mycolicibacterium sphagni]
MCGSRLPDGFAVQLDPRVRVLCNGAALLGGAPTRLLRLSPKAQSLLDNGYVHVRDVVSAQLARTLLDAVVAHPRPAVGPSLHDVTVVIPVRDNLNGLRRLLPMLSGLAVVVVDDASTQVVDGVDLGELHADVTVERHRRSRGPAAARNTGLATCQTEYVAFLDSDVVPRPGWLDQVLAHFSDPVVALVAPRVEALSCGGSAIARYEAVRSSLDLGARESPVIPYSSVSYVPSAAMVVRRAVLVELGGFDEALNSGEDVDLCWRLVDSGARLRYVPSALVAHDHRVSLRKWLARRAFYGTSAAPLSIRHPDKIAPLMLSGRMLAVWILLAARPRSGAVFAVLIAAIGVRRLTATFDGVGLGRGDLAVIAAEGIIGAGLRLASAVCRHYWPVSLVAAIVSKRCRRVVVVAALTDGIVDWASRRRVANAHTERLGLLPYLVLRRFDDIAYGTGLWWGVIRERTLGPLKPQLRR